MQIMHYGHLTFLHVVIWSLTHFSQATLCLISSLHINDISREETILPALGWNISNLHSDQFCDCYLDMLQWYRADLNKCHWLYSYPEAASRLSFCNRRRPITHQSVSVLCYSLSGVHRWASGARIHSLEIWEPRDWEGVGKNNAHWLFMLMKLKLFVVGRGFFLLLSLRTSCFRLLRVVLLENSCVSCYK